MMKQNNHSDFGKHDDFDFDWNKQHDDFDWNKYDDFDWNKHHDNFDWCESPYPYYPYYPYPYPDSGCWEFPPYGCEYPYPYESEDHFMDMGGF